MPQGCIFLYQESHLRILPWAAFYSQSHPVKFKRFCNGPWRWRASPLGSALLWSGPTCRQCSGITLEKSGFFFLCHSFLYFSFPAVTRRKKRVFLLDDTEGRFPTLSNSSLILNNTGSSRVQTQAWLRGVSNPVPSTHVTKPLAHAAVIGTFLASNS